MADLNEELFDVRAVERNIRQGIISRKDYEKYLSAIADEGEEAASTDTRMETFLGEDPTKANGSEPSSPSE